LPALTGAMVVLHDLYLGQLNKISVTSHKVLRTIAGERRHGMRCAGEMRRRRLYCHDTVQRRGTIDTETYGEANQSDQQLQQIHHTSTVTSSMSVA